MPRLHRVVQINVRFSEFENQLLTELAAVTGLDRSSVLRTAMREYAARFNVAYGAQVETEVDSGDTESPER